MALKDIKLEVGQTALRFWNFETTNKFLQICHWFNIPLTLIGPLSTIDESFCCIVATKDYNQLKDLLRRTDWGVSHPGSVWVVPYTLIFPFEQADGNVQENQENPPKGNTKGNAKQALVICGNYGPPLRVILLPAALNPKDLAQVRDLAEYYCQEVHDIDIEEATSVDEVEHILRDMNPEEEI